MNLHEYNRSVEGYKEDVAYLESRAVSINYMLSLVSTTCVRKVIGRSKKSWLRNKQLPPSIKERLGPTAEYYSFECNNYTFLTMSQKDKAHKQRTRLMRSILLNRLSVMKHKVVEIMKAKITMFKKLEGEVASIEDSTPFMKFLNIQDTGRDILLRWELDGYIYNSSR